MTENDVVNALEKYLTAEGWTLVQKCLTTQQGVDLKMSRDDELLLLEAKGGTSADKSSRRYGKGFTPTQQRHHVAEAVATACALRSDPDYPGAVVAIAFPDTQTHRARIKALAPALRMLSVLAYVVHVDRRVERIV